MALVKKKGIGVVLLAAALMVAILLPAASVYSSLVTSPRTKTDVEAAAAGGYRTFIVFLERPPAGVMDDDAAAHQAWHESFLPSKLTELGEPRLLRSYRFLLNGFAARLTEAELQQVASKPGFVAAFPNAIRYLQTTHTPRASWAARHTHPGI